MKARISLNERLSVQRALVGLLQTRPNSALTGLAGVCEYDLLCRYVQRRPYQYRSPEQNHHSRDTCHRAGNRALQRTLSASELSQPPYRRGVSITGLYLERISVDGERRGRGRQQWVIFKNRAKAPIEVKDPYFLDHRLSASSTGSRTLYYMTGGGNFAGSQILCEVPLTLDYAPRLSISDLREVRRNG